MTVTMLLVNTILSAERFAAIRMPISPKLVTL
jgi:hypothetical protein